jgi:hypothetical protein
VKLFDSVKMYVFAFFVYALVALEKLYELARATSSTSSSTLGGKAVFLILVTVCVAAYLIGLLRKTSNKIEQSVILLTEALCLLELAHLLVILGAAWAAIPSDQYVITIVHLVATILAGVRTFQVLWHRSPMTEAH